MQTSRIIQSINQRESTEINLAMTKILKEHRYACTHKCILSLCFKKLKYEHDKRIIQDMKRIKSNQIYSVWDKNKEWNILSSRTSSDNHING